MPELAQLFLLDAAGREAAEIRDTLLRHRVFRAGVAARLGELARELERADFRVVAVADGAAARELAYAVTGSWGLIAAESALLAAARDAAAARGLPVLEI